MSEPRWPLRQVVEAATLILAHCRYEPVNTDPRRPSTRDQILAYLIDRVMPNRGPMGPKLDVEDVIDFVHAEDVSGDVIASIKEVFSQGTVSHRDLSAVGYAVEQYRKQHARQADADRLTGNVQALADGERHTISGTVVRSWPETTQFGTTWKMTVETDSDGPVRLTGTRPKKFDGIADGQTVQFDAKVTADGDGLGDYERPTKATKT